MLLLYPGAGSDASHSSLVAIEQWVAPHPCRRLDFPYRRAGRKAPDRAPVLLAAVRDHIAAVDADEPLVLGGRSMGGRVCSMIAAGADGSPAPARLKGLVLISYPLHPPGKPDRLRVEHLAQRRGQKRMRRCSQKPKRAKVRHLFLEGRGHDLKASDHTIAGAVTDFLTLVL